MGYGPALIQTIQQNRETIAADFMGYINGAYKTNGAIFACMLTRMFLFSEVRFQFRRMNNGRPGKLFGTADLELLEHPWPNATTGDLLMRAINDIDLAGNFYATVVPLKNKKGRRIARLRPDWVTIIKGSVDDPQLSAWDPTAELVGYVYEPGGQGSGLEPHFYLPEEVAHVAPIIDPIAQYRGMSWCQPILDDILGDRTMNTHKIMYFQNGATPNLVVSMDTGRMDRETFAQWIDMFESEKAGAINAYKTLYLGQGATAEAIGSNIKDLDYRAVQGQTELRICAAAGLSPMVVGFYDGLQAATHENFHQAVRLTADKTFRPLWRNFAGSMETIIPAPPGSELWYDDRDVPFLQEDEADAADVLLTKSTAMRLLVDAGYEPDSVVQAMEANDLSLLVGSHTGLYSVQLQPPGSQNALPNGNGNGSGKVSQNSPSGNSGTLSASSADRRDNFLTGVGNVEQLAKALLAAKK